MLVLVIFIILLYIFVFRVNNEIKWGSECNYIINDLYFKFFFFLRVRGVLVFL